MPSSVPSPNAYDFYVKAGQALVAGTPAVDPIYRPGSYGAGVAQDEHRYPLAVKQAWLKQNAATLAWLRQAFKHTYREPPQQPGSAFPVMARFRELARLLIVESHAYSQQGDWRGASDSALDAMHLGHDVARGGVLISALVSYAIQAISHRELWRIVPHLDAVAARAAAARLEGLREHRVSFVDTMVHEKGFMLAELRHQMQDRNWRRGFADMLTAQEKQAVAAISATTIIADFTRAMDAVIANSRGPYHLERPLPPSGDPVTGIMVPLYCKARFSAARNDARDDMLMVALALRAYRLEHQAYPARLEDLVPVYLKLVPPDPFGSGEPLRYRLEGDSYRLWSIGPDGVDNGGEPIRVAKAATTNNPDLAILVLPDSKGDIVAGINR